MPVIVNGVELNDADLERELPLHAEAGNPMREAVTALVLRRVLLDEAGRQGLDLSDEESAIGALLASQAPAPEADEAACRRFYQMHPERFMVGELVEADHILFQVTPDVNLDMLKAHANVVLADLLADPSRFAEVARAQSNCPSAAVGGNLGQLGRGDLRGEPLDAVVGGMHLQQQAGGRAQRGGVIAQVRAVGGTDLDQPGTGAGHDLRHPERAARGRPAT